jgi:hypothetical protein
MLPGSVTLRPAPCAMTGKVHRTVLAPAEARSVIARRNRTELVLSRGNGRRHGGARGRRRNSPRGADPARVSRRVIIQGSGLRK